MIESQKLQNHYSICNDCKFSIEENNKSKDQLQIYIISDVELILHFKCQKLENIIEDETIQYDDLVYYIWNHVAQSLSLQIKMFTKSAESNFIQTKIPSKECQTTYCNFFIIIRNINKKIKKQFIVLSEFMEQLLIDAINKFLQEGDQFIDEWLDSKLHFLNLSQPDLVVIGVQ